jgi:BirA family transcriptional regulator, biotin operon repressor / biotin---[acetyl-CoA-carboxylase] ligase
MSEIINTDLLPLPQLETRIVGGAIRYFVETESTNTCALEACEDGSVFIAESQTAGRGRHGTRWHSAPSLGLWFSVCLAAPLQGINFAAALAVRNAVADEVALTVKWPNDLYAGQRKVCGILIEQRKEWFALGIGLNVNHQIEDFPSALRHRAGSLLLASGHHWDRGMLLVRLLAHLDAMVVRLRKGECSRVREEWIDACAIIGRHIRRGAVSGRVTAVDDNGALLVQTESGVRCITSSDIAVLG